MYFAEDRGTDMQGVSGKIPGPWGINYVHPKEVWGVYQKKQQGHFMQSHCKSKRQTDNGKSMWVAGAISYSQEQLSASQRES